MYEIEYLQKALDDLDEIHFYTANDNLLAADKIVNDILDAVDRLKIFPFIGTVVADKISLSGDYRMMVFKPYLIIYRVIDTQIFIYRILHERRYRGAILN